MTEENVTSASDAGREADAARPADLAPPGESDTAADDVVAYLLDAPDQLKDWASEQLAALDPDGEITARVAERTPDTPSPSAAEAPRSTFPWKGVLIGAALLAVVLGVYYLGLPKDEAPPAATPTMGTGTTMGGDVPVFEIDAEREAELEAQIAANPDDLDALKELASMYFEAGDWPKATTWLISVVEKDPNDIDSRLMLGVTHFNVGSIAQAEAQWREVTEIDPNSIEAYYNLGFVYLSQDPPETEAANEAWARVIEIDPTSPLADVVRTHIDGTSTEG